MNGKPSETKPYTFIMAFLPALGYQPCQLTLFIPCFFIEFLALHDVKTAPLMFSEDLTYGAQSLVNLL